MFSSLRGFARWTPDHVLRTTFAPVLCLVGLLLLSTATARAQYLTLTNLYLTPNQTIELQGNPPSNVTVTGLVRNPGPITSMESLSNYLYRDHAWQTNTHYEYYLTGTIPWYDPVTQQSGIAPWRSNSVFVTVRQASVAADQAVTTRIDPRYSTYTLASKGVGYQYGTGLYRGGLFAGYNNDGAKVARTYLKFSSLLGPLSGYSSEQLWNIGGLWAYCTRLGSTGSTTLLARAATGTGTSGSTTDTWDPTTLAWSIAPAPSSTGAGTTTISWNSASPAEQWVTFNVIADLTAALPSAGGSGTLTEILLAQNEGNGGTSATFPLTANAGWAYFARSSYQESSQSFPAYLLYAFGGSGLSAGYITFSPASVQGGSSTSVTGTVYLSSNAPTGGATVSLSSDTPSAATVPSSVTISAGSNSATFSVSTSAVAANTTVTITATLSGTSTTGTLAVTH